MKVLTAEQRYRLLKKQMKRRGQAFKGAYTSRRRAWKAARATRLGEIMISRTPKGRYALYTFGHEPR